VSADTPLERTYRYHERTKHFPMRYARSLGYLDWDNQPDPFRRFAGARRVLLPLDPSDAGPAYPQLYAERPAEPAALSAVSLGRFFEISLAITAWKSHASARWALRANPSSGNLHPTEGYCWLPPIAGIGDASALYHYRSLDHALEERCAVAPESWDSFAAPLGAGAFLVGLSSIHWREAWKYGERAFRYCQHDIGHAIGALRFAAAALGWRLALLDEPGDDDVSTLLGIDRAADFEGVEREHPDCLALVWPGGEREDLPLERALVAARAGRWSGRANLLSAERVEWEVIDDVADATKKRRGAGPAAAPLPNFPEATLGGGAADPNDAPAPAAVRILRQRRSAVAYDGRSSIPKDRFLGILDRVLPRRAAPFDALAGAPGVHLAIFVHRVADLESGLYLLLRDPAARESLASCLRPAFEWRAVEGAPAWMPLFLLKRGDMTAWGRAVSCDQEIAADGAFSLGMLASFEERCAAEGPSAYRRLHWEAGLVGQALYLELEAAGIRGTGIGCFYDDEMHGVLGLRTRRYHTFYHFAAGTPVDDPRLQTSPPYAEGARLLAP
jgi:SagB-type dehydrogenase family enzyme